MDISKQRSELNLEAAALVVGTGELGSEVWPRDAAVAVIISREIVMVRPAKSLSFVFLSPRMNADEHG